MSETKQLVDKLWNFCNLLRDDGVSTIDYTEQLTYLLFLKMAHERETRPLNPETLVPADCSWQRLLDTDGDEVGGGGNRGGLPQSRCAHHQPSRLFSIGDSAGGWGGAGFVQLGSGV